MKREKKVVQRAAPRVPSSSSSEEEEQVTRVKKGAQRSAAPGAKAPAPNPIIEDRIIEKEVLREKIIEVCNAVVIRQQLLMPAACLSLEDCRAGPSGKNRGARGGA